MFFPLDQYVGRREQKPSRKSGGKLAYIIKYKWNES